MLMMPPSSLSSESPAKGKIKFKKRKKGTLAHLAPTEGCTKPTMLHGEICVIKSLMSSVENN